MSNRIDHRRNADLVLTSAEAAMKQGSTAFSDAREVASAYLGAVVLAVDELQQIKNDEALIELGKKPFGAPVGKGTQAMERAKEKMGIARPREEMSEITSRFLSKEGMIVGSVAGVEGQSFHTLTLVALMQTNDHKFTSSIERVFEANGFELTEEGYEVLADKMREEIGQMAKQSRDSFAAPSAQNIQVDLSELVRPKPGSDNTPS